MSDSYEWPAHFRDLKRDLVSATTEEHLTASWNDLLAELAKRTAEIAHTGTDYIPQVDFADLDRLTPEEIGVIKRKGSVVIRNIVDLQMASGWKTEIEAFLKANPHTRGSPEHNKEIFAIYWSRPQVHARTHPNVLKATSWLNKLYHLQSESGESFPGVDLSTSLTYADRFRIRRPGSSWRGWLPPHIDGGGIERWEDKEFSRCYEDIFTGNWRQHDPYDFEHRLGAQRNTYAREGQTSVFRTWQGWMALSDIAPTQGTLALFPDIQLSNAYILLRPFFRPTVPLNAPDILDPRNWTFDISTTDFPGIPANGGKFSTPWPTPEQHPHLRLEETMVSIPKVTPGDMVFWHCDMIHAVEAEHTGTGDSAVMYIPAVPKTPQTTAYVREQAEAFRAGLNPPDDVFPSQDPASFVGYAGDKDITEPVSRLAMGLPIEVA